MPITRRNEIKQIETARNYLTLHIFTGQRQPYNFIQKFIFFFSSFIKMSSFISSLYFKCDDQMIHRVKFCLTECFDHSGAVVVQRFQSAEVEISSSPQQGWPKVPGSPRREEMRL